MPKAIDNLSNSEFFLHPPCGGLVIFGVYRCGCFSFAYRTLKTTACSFEFCIALHKDDGPLLRAIQKRLNIGNVNMLSFKTCTGLERKVRGNKAIFIIGSKDALLVEGAL
jgi:hypothetical protein